MTDLGKTGLKPRSVVAFPVNRADRAGLGPRGASLTAGASADRGSLP